MWSETTRSTYERSGLRCASDLTDAERNVIGSLLPALGWLTGVPFAATMETLITSLSLFFAGLTLILIALILCYMMLDVDIIRQKAERLAARYRIVRREFQDSFPEDMEKSFEKAVETQPTYWRFGVGLAWVSVLVGVLSFACFVAGGNFGAIMLGGVT